MPPNDFLADVRAAPGHAEPVLSRVKRVAERYSSGRGEAVDDALGDTVWGAIRWNRHLGWPTAPRMADGFLVQFQYRESDPYVGVTGGKKKYRWKNGAPPLLWDGPHDEEHFRVSFLYHGRREWKQGIIMALRTDVEWEGMMPWWISPGRRILFPEASINGDGTFELNPVGPTFIDDFVVTNRYY
jgi:hypothetical protein